MNDDLGTSQWRNVLLRQTPLGSLRTWVCFSVFHPTLLKGAPRARASLRGPENVTYKASTTIRSTDLLECGVSAWDAAFIDVEQSLLFELILAANASQLRLTSSYIRSLASRKAV